ncbi:MAG: hypothetical protein KGL39_14445 [Patescibacteria group bacterium]|nr:hypothetical protein [Patescibacteria group bacterium]
MANNTTPSNGLLQDIPYASIPNVPYTFGSPQYQAAILPYLEQALQAQAERGANSRGIFYSGPAQADEMQAASNLAYQMAQEGAQEQLSQQQLQQQEQQQAALQQESESAAMNQAKAGAKAQEISGALGGIGQLGGLFAASKLGLLPGGKAPPTFDSQLVPGTQTSDAITAAASAPATSQWVGVPYAAPSDVGSAALAAPQVGATTDAAYNGLMDAGLSPQEAAQQAEGFTSPEALGSGALGGYLGYNIGGEKGTTQGEIGAGLGGLAGMAAANTLLPGSSVFAPLALSALGSFGGKFLGNLF